jgi:hypothetical protein
MGVRTTDLHDVVVEQFELEVSRIWHVFS